MVRKQSFRPARIAEQIRQELAKILQFEIDDQRLYLVSLTDVVISKDLSSAKVYFSLLDERDAEQALTALNDLSKSLRYNLAQKIRTLRIMPELRFYYDSSILYGNRLSALIDQAVSEDKKQHQVNQDHSQGE